MAIQTTMPENLEYRTKHIGDAAHCCSGHVIRGIAKDSGYCRSASNCTSGSPEGSAHVCSYICANLCPKDSSPDRSEAGHKERAQDTTYH